MLTINGRKFAKNDNEFLGSLFDAAGTCSGFYKMVRGGCRLYNMQKDLFAFVVNNKHGEQFFVSAHMFDGKPRYMHALTDKDSALLGFGVMTYRQQREAAEALFA